MTKITADHFEEAEWDDYLKTNPTGSFLQSFQYGQFYKDLGYKVWRLGSANGQGLSGVCLLVKLATKLGSFIYCPGGPVLDDWENDFEFFLRKAEEIGRSERVNFVRFDPRSLTEAKEKILSEKGLVKATTYTQPQCTQLLDLTKPLDEIRKNFSDSTRHNIGWVERKGVRVKTSQNPDDIDIFVNLLRETARRQHFRLHAKEDYYKKQYLALSKKNLVKLFLAYEPEEFGEEVLAAAVVVHFGATAIYLHAASSSKSPKLRAPYLMQWKIIQDAKESGKNRYDFWGVASSDDPKDPWAGVTEFKKSFGGEKVFYQPPYDLALTRGYNLDRLVERLRKPLRNILR